MKMFRFIGVVFSLSFVAIITAGFARAADVPNYPKASTEAMVEKTLKWTGWYAGAFWGYGWGKSNPNISSITGDFNHHQQSYVNQIGGVTGPDQRMDGAVIGGQLGYDWQIDPRIVVGLVGDFAWSGIHGTSSLAGLQMTRDMKWIGNLDVRAGYLITPQTLAYVIGGASVAKFNTDITNIGWGGGYGPISFSNASDSATKWGWNIGGGLESKIGRNWSIFGDARYFKFGDTSTVLPGVICETPLAASIVNKNEFAIARIGLNWRPSN